MNARTEPGLLSLRLASPYGRSIEVTAYGVPMAVTYEFYEGEAPILWPTETAHPGSPANCQLLSCRIGGVEVYDMLNSDQIERIEEKILEQLEE